MRDPVLPCSRFPSGRRGSMFRGTWCSLWSSLLNPLHNGCSVELEESSSGTVGQAAPGGLDLSGGRLSHQLQRYVCDRGHLTGNTGVGALGPAREVHGNVTSVSGYTFPQ